MDFDINLNPVTKDWVIDIREAEKRFEQKVRKNPERDLYKAYSKFYYFLFDYYFGNELCLKYKLLSHIRHEWANLVNIPVGHLISKFREKKSDNVLEQIIRDVKLTSKLFEVWEEVGNDNGQSLLSIFQKIIALTKTTRTHKIIVIGEELLSNIEQIQIGHKGANSIYLLTLLENAQKYSPEGSTITIEISHDIYPPVLSEDDGKLLKRGYDNYHLSVSDEGIGIPLEDQERVLKQGQRGSNVGDITGTGLGLFLIYELSNWQIEIISPLYPEAEKYKGTKIKVELYDW